MRAALITIGSIALTASVIGNAYFQKKQFYPSVVYITKSNPSMAVSSLSFFSDFILIISFFADYLFTSFRLCVVDG